MGVKLAAASGGSIELVPTNTASNFTVTVPATTGTAIIGVNGITSEAQGGTGTTTGYYGFKNRIINGAMVIDQRNAGASQTIASGETYTVDRWLFEASQASKLTSQQNAGSLTPLATTGFTNYLGLTSTSAYSVTSSDYFWLEQRFEGFNTYDLAYGTASAQTVTLSFWVYSSLTGDFGASIANNATTRCYPFNYTISSANTWTKINVTIPGDTSGTWTGATNANSLRLQFSLGTGSSRIGSSSAWGATDYRGGLTGAVSVVGTNGATFYITGVQLEKGSTATSFDYRPYGTELMLCQRYYWKWNASTTFTYFYTGMTLSSVNIYGPVKTPVSMRVSPTLTTTGTASDYGGYQGGSSITCNAVPVIDTSNPDTPLLAYTFSGGLTVGYASIMGSKVSTAFLGFNAEL